jgi:hypothetical protein
MSDQNDVNDRRINVFVSPGAKQMLRTLGEAWYPNLKRPDGTVIEQLIRRAYAEQFPVTNEPYDPRGREQQMRNNASSIPAPDAQAPLSSKPYPRQHDAQPPMKAPRFETNS